MAAKEFRGGMHHHIGSVLYRAKQIGSGKGVINNQGHVVAMGHLGHGIQISNIGVRIAKGLHENGLRVGTDGGFEGLEVVHPDDGVAHALRVERMGDEIERTAVEIVGCYDVVALLADVLQRIGYGCRAAGHCQCGHTAFEGCHTGFENGLRGVGQSAIYIAGIAQGKAIGRMLRIAEYIRGGLINRYGTRIGGGVGLLLTYVQLEGFKVEFLRGHSYLFFEIIR